MKINFFSEYPKINYDLYSNGSSIELTDICTGVSFNTISLPDDAQSYTYYEIFDGDRPDVVSHKLYGTPKYYWTFFLINERLRSGLNYEWPLSQNDFSRYIEREYGKYSAITILPQTDINGKATLDLSLVSFEEKYLKYLSIIRHVSTNDFKIANIVRYDTARHQLVVKDIHRRIITNQNGKQEISRIEIARESFVNTSERHDNSYYTFYWDTSMIDSMPEITDEDKIKKEMLYKESRLLKKEWIDNLYVSLKKPGIDFYGWKNHLSSYISEENYIFGKRLIAASNNFRWPYYFNAAHTYYSSVSDKIKSSYDILTDERVINPLYMSFNEYENKLNDEKRNIKIIRPDYIVDFSRRYFEILNNE